MSAPQPEHSRWFSEQVQPHESALRAYLRSLFPSFVDIDDLVQEAYVRVLRAKDGGRINYVKAFLFSTARNLALDIFRRRKVVSIDGVANLDDLSVLDEKPDIGEALDRQHELEMLAESVRSLPERCRQVLTLRLLYGYSQKEISEQLGISHHTVKAQLEKGVRRCAEFFAQRGMTSSPPSKPVQARER